MKSRLEYQFFNTDIQFSST